MELKELSQVEVEAEWNDKYDCLSMYLWAYKN